jgi:Rhamnan synthesis protein F
MSSVPNPPRTPMRTYLKRSVNRIFRYLLLLPYDILQLIVGYIQFALGRHKIIYSNRTGALPGRQKFSCAAVVAVYPDAYALPFLRNLLGALAEKDFFVFVVSTRRLDTTLSEAILPLCHRLIERHPIGRDFGSYRVGLQWIEHDDSLNDIDTLVLANDSLFYPKAISDVLQQILTTEADWTALFENQAQSSFQVFGRRVFSSSAFETFWRRYQPLSSRKHAIHKGGVALTRALKRAGFQPRTVYNSGKIRQAVFHRLCEDKDPITLNLLIRLCGAENYYEVKKRFIAVNSRIYAGDQNAAPVADESLRLAPTEYIASEIASQLAMLAEGDNLTHRVGLLCNYLFTAPIKRDICYREYGETNLGVYTIADLISLASGFDRAELDAMEQDLRYKGVPTSIRGFRKMLFRAGRI